MTAKTPYEFLSFSFFETPAPANGVSSDSLSPSDFTPVLSAAFSLRNAAAQKIVLRHFITVQRIFIYFVFSINIHRLSRWFFIFGLLTLYYQQRASRAYDDLAVMRLLLATRKRAFLVLNFLHLWLCPSFIFFLIFLLSCLLFYPCFFFFFCFFLIPFSSALFFVHRQSLS